MVTSGFVKSNDTVYISGGPAGSSRSYSATTYPPYPGQFLLLNNGVTVRIGQEPAHNGTAVFDGEGGSYWLVQGWKAVTISGDAGDGVPHFVATNFARIANGANWDRVRISFVDFRVASGAMDLNPANNIEIDHCILRVTSKTADHASFGLFSGTNWDTSVFHHNTVLLPYRQVVNASGGNGPDGLQWNGSGYSIFNNLFLAYLQPDFAGGQHQDGYQATGNGRFIKIYNNTFVNMANYGIFPESCFGGFTDMLIYNNLFYNTDSVLAAGKALQAIAANGNTQYPATRVAVFNNVMVDFPACFALTFRNPGSASSPSSFNDCICANNITLNCGPSIIDANVVTYGNVSVPASVGSTSFVSYVAWGGTSNDMRLRSGAGLLIGTGTNLSRFARSDCAGGARPLSGAWDVGAYSYSNITARRAPMPPTPRIVGGNE
jgi:hypothetical protein